MLLPSCAVQVPLFNGELCADGGTSVTKVPTCECTNAGTVGCPVSGRPQPYLDSMKYKTTTSTNRKSKKWPA